MWSHYKIRGDGRVECIYCGQDYKHNPKTIGTSTLRAHIEVKCKKFPLMIEDKKQRPITHFSKSKVASEEDIVGKKFDLKAIREEIDAYFVLDEMPFKYVEDDGFQRYTRYFYHTFEVPLRIIIARDS